MAVYGQVFQTPSALYTPFTMWALLSLPFALVSRSLAHWAVWLVVAAVAVNSYIVLGLENIYGDGIYTMAFTAVTAGFFILLVAYDRVQNIWPEWARAAWFRLLLIAVIFVFANIALAPALYKNHIAWEFLLAALVGGGVLAYLYMLKDRSFTTPPPARIAGLVLAVSGVGVMASQIGLHFIAEIMDGWLEFGLLVAFLWMAGITFVLAKSFKHFSAKFKNEELVPNIDMTPGVQHKLLETQPSRARTIDGFISELGLDDAGVQQVLNDNLEEQTPWYMEMFLGFSGFLTAIIAMIFIGVLFVSTLDLDSEFSFIIPGLVVFFGAMFVRLKTNGLFSRHFFNTLLLGGGALAAFGFGWMFEGGGGFILLSMVLSGFVLYLVHDRILEFIAAVGFLVMFVYGLTYYFVPNSFILFYAVCATLGVVFLTTPIKTGIGASRRYTILGAAGTALLLAPCFLEATSIVKAIHWLANQSRDASGYEGVRYLNIWILRIISLLITGGAIWYLNTRRGEGEPFRPPLIILGLLLLAIAIMPLGSAAALLVLLTGYILGLRSLAIIGALAQIAYIVWYYYDMNITLLNKSLLLMGFGALLLLVYFIAYKRGARHV